MKNSHGVPGIAAVFATLLIAIIGAQGQALAEEKIAGVAVYCVTPANIFNVMG